MTRPAGDKPPYEQAMDFIAAYDHADAGDYERHVVRVAKTWRRLIRARHNVQGIVDRLVDEFDQPPPDDYGAAWADLKAQFIAWAVAEEWIQPR